MTKKGKKRKSSLRTTDKNINVVESPKTSQNVDSKQFQFPQNIIVYHDTDNQSKISEQYIMLTEYEKLKQEKIALKNQLDMTRGCYYGGVLDIIKI